MKNTSTGSFSIHRLTYMTIFTICLSGLIPSWGALLLGFGLTLTWGNPFEKVSSKLSSLLLKVSVIGLGFGMQMDQVISATCDGFWLTIGSITVVLLSGYWLGLRLKLPRKLAHLTASGTAICGGSAIAAVAPAVKANEQDVSISLGVVFLLNAIALILFPILGHLLGMSQHQFGLWSAIAIHDTSSVVGAAAAYGEESLQVATSVKLARALWIIPISLLSIMLFRNKEQKVKIPIFILLFIGATLFNSYIPSLHELFNKLYPLSKHLLTATLFIIGSNLSPQAIKQVGFRPLLLGIALWLIVGIGSCIIILNT